MQGDRDGQPADDRQARRRSRTVSWDHTVRSDRGVHPQPQGPTSPSLRGSSILELFDNDDDRDNDDGDDDDTMSISRGHSVEKVRFSASRVHSDENDEDYSASVNAILHKRLSVRRGKHQKQRRSSSPVSSMMADDASLLSDRRRSSAFTTSSGDTAINIEEAGISQEQILENIRLHKEVLGSVRLQPWSMRRKMKLVQQAKEYVKKHEGQLQERLAMSKSTRDILARFHILVVKQWQHTKREMANVISQIIPWELTIKEIESQFGTVVASYFTFLRWLFWVNFVISVMLAAFVVIPEVLMTSKADTGERKTLLPEEEATSMQLMTLLNFEGVLQHSPMFYGFYSNRPSSDSGYQLPTAYFITGLVVYIYSFVATLRKMAANSRLSKLSEKDDECVFTWKLFTGWDYMIGNEETAHNRISSIILGFKEALLEEAERMKDKQNWKVVALRIFANLNMVWMLGSSVYTVIIVVRRSTTDDAESTLWRKYEITVVMTLIGTLFPIAFEGLGMLENYHPRTTLRVQLARIMALNLLNLYTLTFALFVKINDMTSELKKLKPLNSTMFATDPEYTLNTTNTSGCIFNTSIGPGSTMNKTIAQALLTTAVLLNSSMMPPMTTPMMTMTSTTTTKTSPPSSDHFLVDHPNCLPFEIREVIPCSGPKKNVDYRPFAPNGSTINSNSIPVWTESLTVPNPTDKPLKTSRKETDGSAFDSKATDELGRLGSPTDKFSTVPKPTDEPVETNRKKTDGTAIDSKTTDGLGRLGSTAHTFSTVPNPTDGSAIDSKAIRNGPLTETYPTHEPIETNQNEPTMADGSSSTVSAQKAVPTSPIAATADGYVPEISAVTTTHFAVSSDVGDLQSSEPPRDDKTTSTWSAQPEIDENATEITSVLSLDISATVVKETSDSELNSGSTKDYEQSTSAAAESISSLSDDPFSSSITTPGSLTESIPSMTAVDTEPTAGHGGGAVYISSTTDQQPAGNDGYYDDTMASRRDTTDEIPTAGPRRVKRTLKMVINDTHCYRIVCSPRPTVSKDETKSSSTPIATEPPGYSVTTEHEDAPREDYSLTATCLSLPTRQQLRKLCWETMFGQELVKLTVMDLVSTIMSTIFGDFARAVFVRYMNRCWCWNLEKRFPQYGDFKIAENILHLVNNQGMVWMGMFFSPGLPIINVVKLMIMMYIRSWAVLTCNVPHDIVFRASRSNNFYLGLLLTMLFLCVLPVGYAIVWIEPSWHCGPFSQYRKIYHIFTYSIKKAMPNPVVHRVLDYIASPGIIIPLLLLLILIIYYLASLTSSLREANNDLKIQLRRERTEERRKMFQLVNSKHRGDDDDDDNDYTCLDTTLSKWRQIMPDNKLTTDDPNFVVGSAEKKHTENDVLDKVREKLVHIETDDPQQPETKQRHGLHDTQHHYHHHLHHHQQKLHHHHHHIRRPSRSEEPRDTAALQRKWKKNKVVLSRRPSTDSESSDQSEAVPEIRVVRPATSGVGTANDLQVAAEGAKSRGLPGTSVLYPPVIPMVVGDLGSGFGKAGGGGSDGKQKARLKLAQILYKEARRRKQKHAEELQNQQE